MKLKTNHLKTTVAADSLKSLAISVSMHQFYIKCSLDLLIVGSLCISAPFLNQHSVFYADTLHRSSFSVHTHYTIKTVNEQIHPFSILFKLAYLY